MAYWDDLPHGPVEIDPGVTLDPIEGRRQWGNDAGLRVEPRGEGKEAHLAAWWTNMPHEIGDDACRLLGGAFLHTSDITIVRDTMSGEDQERHTVYIFPPGHKPGGKATSTA